MVGSAALLVAASVLLGRAVNLLGARCRAAAPAVGLSLLIVIASIAIQLPGHAGTAAVVLLLALLAAAAVVIRRGTPRRRPPVLPLIVAVVATFGASIPFIANGRVGLLGVSLDNDTAAHLIWAEGLRGPVLSTSSGVPAGYPLGPHSLVDAISTGLGVRLDLVFTALLVAIIIITALVGAAALHEEAGWKRLVVGVLAGLLYMVAAYYGEGAFKEPLLGLLLLAMVLQFEEARSVWVASSRDRWRALLPVSLLAGAAIYVYSYLALAWFGLTPVIWVLVEVAVRPRLLRRWRESLADLLAPTALALVVTVVLVSPVAGRIVSFAGSIGVSPAATGAITPSNLGNLAHPLSPYEALGIWNSVDFRFVPADVFHAGELSALALAVLLLGVVWSVGRREFLLPAAVAACAIVYWRSSHGQSPYVTAKALVVAGPVVAVTGLRGLLQTPATSLPRWITVPRLAVAAAFVIFAAYSSYQALRDEPVWPAESTNELLSLDQLTRGQTVLFLGNSDFVAWLFHDSRMSALASTTTSLGEGAATPTKPFIYGTALDFDSVDLTTINRFRWVITSNTADASEPPNAFELVRHLRLYELWKRTGIVAPRHALESSGYPGAVLNCHTRAGLALSRRRGLAAAMAPPLVTSLTALSPGASEHVSVSLAAGRWELSLQYTSAVDLELSAGGTRWRMPAYLDRPGPVFDVGSMTSSGAPVTITVRAVKPSALTGPGLAALPTALVATHSPDVRVVRSLRRSCGRYVDWYQG